MRVGVEIGMMTMAANGAVGVEIGMMTMAANGAGWGGDRDDDYGGERCGLGWR